MRHTRIALIAVVLAACTATVSSGLASAATKVGHITQINLPPPKGPLSIIVGPDGNLWFTIEPLCCDTPKFQFGMLTPKGQFTGFNLPTGDTLGGQIIVGPDGNLWMNTSSAQNPSQFSVVTTQGTDIADYPIPPVQQASGPTPVNVGGMTVGPDGAIWFTGDAESNGVNVPLIGRSDVFGGMTEIDLPSPKSSPGSITAGPDGALWFQDNASGNNGTNSIDRMTTAGAFNSFPTPHPAGTVSELAGLAFGPDGNLWIADATLNTINRMTTTGKATVFSLTSGNPGPADIIAGPDSAMWFVEANSFAAGLGRITMQGKITEFTTPAPSGGLEGGPTSGPPSMPHTVWFTQTEANNIDFITTK